MSQDLSSEPVGDGGNSKFNVGGYMKIKLILCMTEPPGSNTGEWPHYRICICAASAVAGPIRRCGPGMEQPLCGAGAGTVGGDVPDVPLFTVGTGIAARLHGCV